MSSVRWKGMLYGGALLIGMGEGQRRLFGGGRLEEDIALSQTKIMLFWDRVDIYTTTPIDNYPNVHPMYNQRCQQFGHHVLNQSLCALIIYIPFALYTHRSIP